MPARTSFPVDRHLNPEEFPSLAATTKKDSEKKAKEQQQVRAVLAPPPTSRRIAPVLTRAAPARVQELKGWADDERDVPHPGRHDPHW